MQPVEYYDLNGVKVATVAPGEQPAGIAPGIYIVRQGNYVKKIAVN